MEKRFVFEEAPFASCHASTVVEVERGRLLAAWFGGTREGAPDVSVWLASFDGARWDEPRVVADEREQPCWNPVLFRERGGRLFLFYKAGPSPQSWSGFYTTSDDGGRTWSDARILPAGVLGPSKNKPVQLASGRIVAGSSTESYRAWSVWFEISDDGGETWRRRGPLALPDEPYGVIQPTVFRTSDGALRLLARSRRTVGRVCVSESLDEGESWSEVRRTDLPNPNSGIDAVRLGDGRVVLCHNPVEAGRTPLSLSVSTDDGLTWRPSLVLESEPGEYSYPAVIQSADGLVHVTYTWRRERIAHAVIQPAEL